jgi:GTPase SAR1 family protein
VGIFDELDSSVNKLGKTFLFGKKAALSKAKKLLERAVQYYIPLEEGNMALKAENDEFQKTIADNNIRIKNFEEGNMALKAENDEFQKIISDNDIRIKNFELVSDALRAAPVENDFIFQFKNLINKDFVEFCDKEPNLNDTVQFQKLRQVLKEMQLIANCPVLHSKSLGAVGGGFSSGKSSFLNSFLTGTKVRLAEGIHPVTAISSYVICDEESKVNGISYKGGCFNISLEMYKTISHKFLKSFDFDLKEIVLYTTVLAPMNKKYFENLCLIDTPGYNPPYSGFSEKDFETARNYIKDAQFLIWIVGLDSVGAIPKSDLEFLDNLDFGKNEDKHLYIIANKAETKTEDDIEGILDVFEECLDSHDLQYAGISAYSSKTKKVYASRKTDIHSFLIEHNKPGTQYGPLKDILDDVFSCYIGMIQEDFNKKETKRKEVKRLLFDALEGGHIDIDESSNALQEGLNKLIRYFQSDESLEQRLNRAKKIRDLFVDCFHGFCGQMGIERVEYIFCTGCGKRLKKNTMFCTECGKPQ